jgi:hypothetical protein
LQTENWKYDYCKITWRNRVDARSALIVSKLWMIASEIKEGVTTLTCRSIYSWSWRSAQFLGLYGFPNCFAWVQTRKWAWNSNNKPLESGDVISVDCGAFKTDTTVIMRILEIGEVAPKQKNYYKLLRNSCTCGNSRTRLGNRDVVMLFKIYRSPRLWCSTWTCRSHGPKNARRSWNAKLR